MNRSRPLSESPKQTFDFRPRGRVFACVFTAIFALGIGGAISGCDPANDDQLNVTTADTACQSGSAQILVQDGFMVRLCGCQEAALTQIFPPATLTCTVPSGTTVFFLYVGATLTHQIISTGPTVFTSSPVSNPNVKPVFEVYGQAFQTSGTYGFQDAFNGTMVGSIIVP